MGTVAVRSASADAAQARRDSIHEQFAEQGYLAAIPVLSAAECRQFMRAAMEAAKRPPRDWDKGYGARSRAFYEMATHPRLLEVVMALLGDDVMLWGASVRTRPPGATHPWHCDIESSFAPAGKTVSVWMGIEHTNENSSLLLVPYSHKFGITVQEVEQRLGRNRRETTDDDIVRWAQERDARSNVVKLDMRDGEALFFDGKLWHGSRNVSPQTRHALLLQYATPDTPIRIPDLKYLQWPFRQLESPKPECVMVSGRALRGSNRIVPAPRGSANGAGRQLSSRVVPLRTPLAPDAEKGWKPYPIFDGHTGGMRSIACHTSALAHGRSPHPPHSHDEEEILLVLAGEVDVILPDLEDGSGNHRRRLRRGQFVYYPAQFAHTIETVSTEPANYLMFKWCTDRSGARSPMGFGQFDISEQLSSQAAEDGFRLRPVVEGSTAYLRRLHCHSSTLTPGAGYEPHVDAYDVAIMVLEGEVETLGERVVPHGVIFYPAGEPHGMRNPGKSVAKYIVFEFHGSQKGLGDEDSPARRLLALASKLRDPERVKSKVKELYGRFVKAQ